MGVPKSGRPTAFGMCMETNSGYVPTTLISGTTYGIGIAVNNPHRFSKIDASRGFSLRPTVTARQKEIDGDFDLHRTILESKTYDGEFTFISDPENLYYPFLGMFGLDVQSALDTSQSPNAYSHLFQTNKARGYQPTYSVEENFGDHIYGRLSTGCVVQRLGLTFNTGGIMATMAMYASRQIPNNYNNASLVPTDYDFGSAPGPYPIVMGGPGDSSKQLVSTASPTYIDVPEQQDGNGPLVWADAVNGSVSGYSNAFMLIDGVAQNIDLLPGMTINIERVISRRQIAGAGYDVSTFIAHEWMISGRMDLLFLDNGLPKVIMKKGTIGFNIKFVGPAILGGSNAYSFEIYLPNLNFTEGGLEIPDNEMLVGGNYVSRQDPSLGHTGQFTLVNSVSNASLAGKAGSTGSQAQAGIGLGGWNQALTGNI